MLKASEVRFVTVSENTSTGGGILGEWGLCILVEAGKQRVLLDTGAGPSTVHNADSLDVNLRDIETIVISHGHADHTGGLEAVLRRRHGQKTKITAHPDMWAKKYSRRRNASVYRYAGIPFQRVALESLGADFNLTDEPTWITDDIVASGEEPLTTDFEAVSGSLYVRTNGDYSPDPMADDQSLYLKTELGLVIVLGCAHRGMVNIIRHARTLTGMDQVHLVIGGTHLGPASEEQATRTIAALDEIGVERLGVSHCTGLPVAARLAREFGDRFFFNNAGTVLDLAG